MPTIGWIPFLKPEPCVYVKNMFPKIFILKQNIPSRKYVEIEELGNLTIQNQEEEATKRPDTET